MYVLKIWRLLSSSLENSWVLSLWILTLLHSFCLHVLDFLIYVLEIIVSPCIFTLFHIFCLFVLQSENFFLFIFIIHVVSQCFRPVFCSTLPLDFFPGSIFLFLDFIFDSSNLFFFLLPYFYHIISFPAVNFWTRGRLRFCGTWSLSILRGLSLRTRIYNYKYKIKCNSNYIVGKRKKKSHTKRFQKADKYNEHRIKSRKITIYFCWLIANIPLWLTSSPYDKFIILF